MRRIVAIGVGPAELLLSCGGALAMYADAGDKVTALAVQPSMTDDQLKAGAFDDREREAAAFEALGGIQYRRVMVPAQGIEDNRACRDVLMDELRREQPDVIIGPALMSLDSSARTLSRLIFGAAYCSCVPNYPSPAGLEASSVRAAIVHGDPALEFASGTPQYVDIGSVWERKTASLRAMPSHNEGADRDPLYVAETLGRARGVQVQIEFAEAYGLEAAWGRLRAHRLLPS